MFKVHRIHLAFLGGAVVGAVLFVYLFNTSKYRRFANEGVKTTGIVTETLAHGHFKFRYVVNGREYVGSGREGFGNYGVVPGRTVRVTYLPDDPEDATSNDPSVVETNDIWVLGTFVVVVLTVLLCLLLLGRRRRSRPPNEIQGVKP